MDIFRISRELPFEVYNHVEPQASLHTARKGEHFNEEEKEVGRVTVNKEFKVFHWLNAARKGEEYVCFLLDSAIIVEYDIPSVVSVFYLVEVSVYVFTKGFQEVS